MDAPGDVTKQVEAPLLASPTYTSMATSDTTIPRTSYYNASVPPITRQQLVAEIREASSFMTESVTPETAMFWRDHVLNLQERLRTLHGETTIEAPIAKDKESWSHLVTDPYLGRSAALSPLVTDHFVEVNGRPMPYFRLREHYLPHTPSTAAAGNTESNMNSAEPYLHPTEAESLATLLRRYDVTDNVGIEGSQESQVAVAATTMTTLNPRRPILNDDIQPPRAPPTLSTADLPDRIYDSPMVDVAAPADLPAGYQFEAEIEGRRFLATVPPGGVQQGETFSCYMQELNTVSSEIPVGHWKGDLTGVCSYGCCHSIVWSPLVCPLVALSQIQHRIDVDFLGRPRSKNASLSNRSVMLTVIAFWLLANMGLYGGYKLKWSHGIDLTIADWAAFVLVNGAMIGFVVFVAQATRSSLRDKFLIREECCHDLEDLCVSALCLPCAISQMMRHTANYDENEAVCCSKTGLPNGVHVNKMGGKNIDNYAI